MTGSFEHEGEGGEKGQWGGTDLNSSFMYTRLLKDTQFNRTMIGTLKTRRRDWI